MRFRGAARVQVKHQVVLWGPLADSALGGSSALHLNLDMYQMRKRNEILNIKPDLGLELRLSKGLNFSRAANSFAFHLPFVEGGGMVN